MKKKVLVVASTSDHLRTFHIPYIEKLKETCDVFTMSRDVNEQFADFNIKFQKKIMSFKNFKIIGEIKKILKENEFDVVFLNTSLAAFFVRAAIRGLKKKPRVINIVHGYLFGEKTNFFKRQAFLAAEKFVRKQTTNIIVMNNEDYDIVKKHKLCTGEVYKIQGMGINGNRFSKKAIKNTGLEEEINFSFIGELSSRKNQTFLIKFVKELEKFGIKTEVYENEIQVHGGKLLVPSTVLSSHNDHRIAMTMAVLCTITGGTIEGAESVRKSFPNFYEILEKIGICVLCEN